MAVIVGVGLGVDGVEISPVTPAVAQLQAAGTGCTSTGADGSTGSDGRSGTDGTH